VATKPGQWHRVQLCGMLQTAWASANHMLENSKSSSMQSKWIPWSEQQHYAQGAPALAGLLHWYLQQPERWGPNRGEESLYVVTLLQQLQTQAGKGATYVSDAGSTDSAEEQRRADAGSQGGKEGASGPSSALLLQPIGAVVLSAAAFAQVGSRAWWLWYLTIAFCSHPLHVLYAQSPSCLRCVCIAHVQTSNACFHTQAASCNMLYSSSTHFGNTGTLSLLLSLCVCVLK
jgi:hypothetical protein